MCGIVGAYGWADGDVLSDMLDRIAHRGPDGVGKAIGDDVMLGARRLSIIDLARGDQPMSNEDGTVTVVFNGEIYNHEQLREDLRESGHRFTSECDTEVLVHLWEEHGRKMVPKLSGMFSFAIWDRNAETVFLARDRLGIKPLFYAETDDGLVWSSEVQPLLQAGVDRSVDDRAVREFFTFKFTPWSRTLLSDVRKLEPGTWLSIGPDGTERGRYWSLQPEPVSGGIDSITSRVRELLDQSVEKRLMADVPVGAFLSGGLDSSAVVGLMANRVQDLNTYSIAFSHAAHDERSEAAYVADYFETNHHEIEVDLTSMDTFETVVRQFGEPLADPTSLPTYLMAENASQDVKVAVSGAGADELFAGYYHLNTLPRLRRRFGHLPTLAYRFADKARGLPGTPAKFEDRLSAFSSLENDISAYLDGWPGPHENIDRYLTLQTSSQDVEADLGSSFDNFDESDAFKRYTGFDIAHYLQNDLLYKLDQTTMAASIEGRVPYLDHELVTFAYGIPEEYKVDGTYKPVLRRAVDDVLPKRTKERTKSHFSVPIHSWFSRQDLPAINRWLAEEKLVTTPFVSSEAVLDAWKRHRKGEENNESVLWRTLNYVAWYHTIVQDC